MIYGLYSHRVGLEVMAEAVSKVGYGKVIDSIVYTENH